MADDDSPNPFVFLAKLVPQETQAAKSGACNSGLGRGERTPNATLTECQRLDLASGTTGDVDAAWFICGTEPNITRRNEEHQEPFACWQYSQARAEPPGMNHSSHGSTSDNRYTRQRRCCPPAAPLHFSVDLSLSRCISGLLGIAADGSTGPARCAQTPSSYSWRRKQGGNGIAASPWARLTSRAATLTPVCSTTSTTALTTSASDRIFSGSLLLTGDTKSTSTFPWRHKETRQRIDCWTDHGPAAPRHPHLQILAGR